MAEGGETKPYRVHVYNKQREGFVKGVCIANVQLRNSQTWTTQRGPERERERERENKALTSSDEVTKQRCKSPTAIEVTIRP